MSTEIAPASEEKLTSVLGEAALVTVPAAQRKEEPVEVRFVVAVEDQTAVDPDDPADLHPGLASAVEPLEVLG